MCMYTHKSICIYIFFPVFIGYIILATQVELPRYLPTSETLYLHFPLQ